MPSINLEKICYIIIKAREFHEKVAPDDLEEGSNASDDRSVGILESHAGDPTYQELMAALEGLNEDEIMELLALTWIGRGDFGAEEWADAMRQAREIYDAHTAANLASTPMLGDLLEEGMAAFGLSCEEVELRHL